MQKESLECEFAHLVCYFFFSAFRENRFSVVMSSSNPGPVISATNVDDPC